MKFLPFLLEIEDPHLDVLSYGQARVCHRGCSLGPAPDIDMEEAARGVQGDAHDVPLHVQHLLRLRDGGHTGQVSGAQPVKSKLEKVSSFKNQRLVYRPLIALNPVWAVTFQRNLGQYFARHFIPSKLGPGTDFLNISALKMIVSDWH